MTNSADNAVGPESVNQAMDRVRDEERAARDEVIAANINRGERLTEALTTQRQDGRGEV